MRIFRTTVSAAAVFLVLFFPAAESLSAQSRGLEAIRGADMKVHLDFLGAPVFNGRPAPSAEVEIASLYLAREARARGLRPILPDGSFFQAVPIEVTTLSPSRSRLRLISAGEERVFSFPGSFGINTAQMRSASEAFGRGGIVFIGPAGGATEESLGTVDLRGKIAVALGGPASPPPSFSPVRFVQEKGALGFLTIVSVEQERMRRERGLDFDETQRLRFPSVDMTAWSGRRPAAGTADAPFIQLELGHEAGAAVLGITPAELAARFEAAAAGPPPPARPVEGRVLCAEIAFDVRTASASNVIGWIEGIDPVLKNEFVTITAHQDHVPMREGDVYPGADDNGSGAVAMLELIEALVIERPKRSVVFAWTTAEERGLVGAFHFIQHCPVPVERISANLNLDMLSRNDPEMIYFVGSKALSSEFDRLLRAANARSAGLRIDDAFQSPDHPEQFFFRSDHFPHIQYGIPGVWIFCGTTPDYHTPFDRIERVDYGKMERVTKFVYVACLDIGNAPALMKLDVRPDVISRGPQNMKTGWRR